MKKLCFFLLVCSAHVTMTNAQEYKKFKVAIGLGYATPIAGNNEPMVGDVFTIEPSYRLSDDLAIGLRYESAVLVNYDFDFTYYVSYTLNGQYYLSKNKFRPFIGGGLGMFIVGSDYYEFADPKVGFYPRAGFDFGHFNVTLDYNLMVGSNGALYNISDHYLGIRAGISIGGGKKRNQNTDEG